MTSEEFLGRLIRLAHVPTAGGTVLTSSAALQTEAFRRLQEDLAQLIEDVANEVEGGPERVAREFPDVFIHRDW